MFFISQSNCVFFRLSGLYEGIFFLNNDMSTNEIIDSVRNLSTMKKYLLCFPSRNFNRFWSMGQIGSIMVSVAPLGTHLEPINKELMLLVTI